jgi:hypothetical protein
MLLWSPPRPLYGTDGGVGEESGAREMEIG